MSSERGVAEPLLATHNSELATLLTALLRFGFLVVLHAVNRVTGELDLDVVGLIDLDGDLLVADLGDHAEDAADRLDALAGLEFLKLLGALLVLVALGAEDEEVEDGDADQQRHH